MFSFVGAKRETQSPNNSLRDTGGRFTDGNRIPASTHSHLRNKSDHTCLASLNRFWFRAEPHRSGFCKSGWYSAGAFTDLHSSSRIKWSGIHSNFPHYQNYHINDFRQSLGEQLFLCISFPRLPLPSIFYSWNYIVLTLIGTGRKWSLESIVSLQLLKVSLCTWSWWGCPRERELTQYHWRPLCVSRSRYLIKVRCSPCRPTGHTTCVINLLPGCTPAH